MKYTVKLNDNKDFVSLYKKGKYTVGRCCAVYFRKNGRGFNRVGFSSGKKVGNAVRRNLVKRRLREAFRMEMPEIKNGLYIVAARSLAAEADFRTLQKSLKYLLKKHKLYLTQS